MPAPEPVRRLAEYFRPEIRNQPARAVRYLLEYLAVPKRFPIAFSVETGAGTLAAGAASLAVKASGDDVTLTTSAGAADLPDGETVAWSADYPHELDGLTFDAGSGSLLVARVDYE